MKLARGIGWSVLLYMVMTGQVLALSDDDVGEIFRMPSMQGLSGLLTMNTPSTVGSGGFALSIYGLGESGTNPDYSTVQVPVVLLIGFSENVEIAARAKLITATGGTTAAGTPRTSRDSGAGDSEFLVKWKFRNQNENLPTMALGLGLLFPTGDADKGFSEADNWGGKFMVMAASETAVFENSYLGLYGEAQVVMRDRFIGGTSTYSDTYGVGNFGLTFPISDDNHLLFTVEYNRFFNKLNLTLGDSEKATTPSLRYVTKHINISAGIQFLDDNAQSSGHRDRLIVAVGVTY